MSAPPPTPVQTPAPPIEVTAAGRVYRFAPGGTPEVVGPYEDYLEGQAWLTLRRARRHLDPAEYQEQSDGTRRDLEAGVLKAGQPFYFKSLSAREHQKNFLLFAARHLDQTVGRADIDALFADPLGFKAVSAVLDKILMDPDSAGLAEALAKQDAPAPA